MSNFLSNAILTKYAFNRINLSLTNIQDNYNFNKIVLSDTSITLSENFSSTYNAIYEAEPTSIIIENNKITIRCTLHANIENLIIKSIFIYENNNLFLLASIDTIKPAGLTFDLVLDIDTKIQLLNINITPTLVINDYNYATEEDKDSAELSFADSNINIARANNTVSTLIGYDKAGVFYNKEVDQYNNFYNSNSIERYIKIKNSFYKTDASLMAYYDLNPETLKYIYNSRELMDLYNPIYIESKNNILKGKNLPGTTDKLYFNNTGGTIAIKAFIQDVTQGIILSKGNADTSYLNISSTGDTLQFTLYGETTDHFLTSIYDLSTTQIRNITEKINLYVLVYNYSTNLLDVYLNDKKLNLSSQINTSFTSPSKSIDLPVINYIYINNTISYKEKNYFYNFMSFNKSLSLPEIKLLNTLCQ